MAIHRHMSTNLQRGKRGERCGCGSFSSHHHTSSPADAAYGLPALLNCPQTTNIMDKSNVQNQF